YAHVKGEVMAVFDRTFKVTDVLTWLAGGVAFCGLAGSLLALSLARRRDYSVLAAAGTSGGQTAVWGLAQGVLIAVISGAASAAGAAGGEPQFGQVLGPRTWSFPRDHGRHDGFKTEWWYFTGNLREKATGRTFGYQLTFFRSSTVPRAATRPSAWAANDLY